MDRANLSVSWRAVAIASIISALAALTITAIVATVKQADTLSVVALGVAVVAFIIQIIVFIVQAAAASEQSLRAQEVYGSTLKVLTTIEEKAEGTRQAVSTMSDRMLTAIIEKAIPASVSDKVSMISPDFSSEVAQRVLEIAEGRPTETPSQRRTTPRRREIRKNAIENVTFPAVEDVQRVMPKIQDLDGSALLDLNSLGKDWIRWGSNNTTEGLADVDNLRLLYDRGLVHRVVRDWYRNGPVFALTADGKVAVLTLLAEAVPDNAPSEVLALRQALTEALRDEQRGQADTYADIPVDEG